MAVRRRLGVIKGYEDAASPARSGRGAPRRPGGSRAACRGSGRREGRRSGTRGERCLASCQRSAEARSVTGGHIRFPGSHARQYCEGGARIPQEFGRRQRDHRRTVAVSALDNVTWQGLVRVCRLAPKRSRFAGGSGGRQRQVECRLAGAGSTHRVAAVSRALCPGGAPKRPVSASEAVLRTWHRRG